METDKILDEISRLPPEAQNQVKDFVAFLRMRYRKRPDPRKGLNRAALENEPFIGIWRNREDMKDSRSWLRNLRKSEWEEKGD